MLDADVVGLTKKIEGGDGVVSDVGRAQRVAEDESARLREAATVTERELEEARVEVRRITEEIEAAVTKVEEDTAHQA